MYILVMTARRKNAKRHIITRSADIEYLREWGRTGFNKAYTIEIYTGGWKLVEVLQEGK